MTVDWQDGQTHLRVIDRGKNLVGVVLEERATLNALPQLRANKAGGSDGDGPVDRGRNARFDQRSEPPRDGSFGECFGEEEEVALKPSRPQRGRASRS